MIDVIRCITPDRIIQLGNEKVAARIYTVDGLFRDDGEPGHDGDVLCITPDGRAEARPHVGPWETAIQTSRGLVYRPIADGPAYLVVFTDRFPT